MNLTPRVRAGLAHTFPAMTPTPPYSKRTKALSATGILIGAGIGLFVLVLCGGFTFGLVLPALRQARLSAQRTAAAARLVEIGQALQSYANLNNGAFPEAGADLSQRLAPHILNNPTVLNAPNGQTGLNWFYYVPGRTLQSPDTTILLYENPAFTDGSGGHVVYRNLYNTFISQPSFSEMVDEIKLDDGRPWTPHKLDWVTPAVGPAK